MEEAFEPLRLQTFVIQVVPSATGELTGVIHEVRTREKRRFEGMEELSAAIRAMGRRDSQPTGTELC